MSLLAGSIGGAGSLDGTGPAARFCLPTGMAMDGAGNLFVADNGSNIIRKVVLATGEVTTFAGRAIQKGSTDGVGVAARFSLPHGLASDGAGNLFVADRGNYAVRRIEIATGRVSTLAGSPEQAGVADGVGTAATFRAPAGIAADGAGFIYVTDQDSHTIRRIRLADGQVSTFAGQADASGDSDGVGTAARFHSPDGLVLDSSGTLFVADAGNRRIRAIVLASAAVTTLGAGSFDRPSGIVSDGRGRLYVTDRYEMVVRALDTASGAVSLLAGNPREAGHRDGTGASAVFSSPWGMVLDGKGNLLVGDQSNHVLRQIALATGSVTTVAGRPAEAGGQDGIGDGARFSRASGMASDGQGSLYVADTYNHAIRRVVLATGAVTTFAGSSGRSGSSDGVGTAASFSRPEGIVSDGQGNLFVTDSGNHVIRRIAIATAQVTTWAGAAGVVGNADGVGENARFSSPQSIAADDAGDLFVSDASMTIRRIAISTRTVTTLAGVAWSAGKDDGVGAQARFSSPRGLEWDAGSLFVADAGNQTIRRVSTADGMVTTVAGSPGQAGTMDGTGAQARFGAIDGLAVDRSGHLFVADQTTVRKLTISTAAVTTVVGSIEAFGIRLGPLPGSLGNASGLVFAEPGTLFISGSGTILRAGF